MLVRLLVPLILLIFPTTSYADGSPPNVLLIVADDMGYTDIGPFGGEISTPALDALASEALSFTNFHVLASCSPSRSVLLSGMDNHRAGLGTMYELMTEEIKGQPGYEGHLNHRLAALPEVLSEYGYSTYMVGKWHLGEEPEDLPSARGFDDTFILVEGGGSHWQDQKWVTPTVPMNYSRNGQAIRSLPEDFYSTKNYTDELVQWLQRDKESGKPFFAYVAYTAPHDPLHAPADYIAKYKGRYDAGWDVLRDDRLNKLREMGIVAKDAVAFPRLPSVSAWADLSPQERALAARDMEVYAAMIDYMDQQIQRIFDTLKQVGRYDDTLIIFMSDNGANGSLLEEYPGQTEEYISSFDNSLENRGLPNSLIDMGPGWAQASMTPSRMYKGFAAEGGVRSPLLIKLPENLSGAKGKNSAFLHMRDIMPTILDVAGLDLPGEVFQGKRVQPVQGTSVLPVLLDQQTDTTTANKLVGYELFGMKAFFDGRWKAMWMPEPVGSGGWELYDLESDPGELMDRSKELPEKRDELVARWKQYSTENGVIDTNTRGGK